ncbi:hypothetical protein KFK09_011490 [Dendrobium nobile]|uniref:Uncharacterized protein n=1 Tax=Dendrobium nobile TaxID=94219 RepID=A0A8T3BF26_DENNO|nr:hypothetical protein KFK09_011490 [Dendrobium nobile]
MSSLLFWNCRGAKKEEASHYLRCVIKDNGVFFVGLLETKLAYVKGIAWTIAIVYEIKTVRERRDLWDLIKRKLLDLNVLKKELHEDILSLQVEESESGLSPDKFAVFRMKNLDSIPVNDPDEIHSIFEVFFQNKWKFRNCSLEGWPMEQCFKKLNVEQQNLLMADFSKNELLAILEKMENNKSPWSDGVNAFFFKSYWNIIHIEVWKAVKSFFDLRSMLEDWSKALNKLKIWGLRNLSLIGKIALLKSIFSSIPLFSMAYSLVPKRILQNRISVVGISYGIKKEEREVCVIYHGTFFANQLRKVDGVSKEQQRGQDLLE